MIPIPLNSMVFCFKQLRDLLTLPHAGVNAVSELLCTMSPDPTSQNNTPLPEVSSSTISHSIFPFSLKSLNFTSFLFSSIPLCLFMRKIFIMSREWIFQLHINAGARNASTFQRHRSHLSFALVTLHLKNCIQLCWPQHKKDECLLEQVQRNPWR